MTRGRAFSHPSRQLAALALLLPAILQGCSRGDAALAPPTEPEVLAVLATQGAQPAFARVATSARELATAADALCARRDAASLEQVRVRWRAAYLDWRRALPFMFGPADEQDFKRRIGIWPVNDVVLAAVVTSPELRGLRGSADVRGYAAAEFLLFVPADAAAATAADRCEHLRDVTREIAEVSARTSQRWDEDYGRRFTAAGDGQPFLTPNEALTLAAAESVNVTERILWDNLGMPSGFFQDPPRPDMLDAWRSGSTRDGLRAMVEGLRTTIIGDGRTGLAGLVATKDGLVEHRDPVLAARMERQIARILDDLDDDWPDIHTTLETRPKLLQGLYRDLQTLQDQLVEATLVLELDVRSHAENHQD